MKNRARKEPSCRACSRRDFLMQGAVVGLGVPLSGALRRRTPGALGPVPSPIDVPPLEKIRMGFVGVGLQGSAHVRNFLRIEGVEIRALGDIVESKVGNLQDQVEAAGYLRPEAYTKGETDFLRMCERDDLDLIVTATPWKWHVPVCVAAMRSGKHAATEVPAALTLDECWQLVETSEKTGRHCVMLENCCYSDRALMALRLVREGILGEVIHGTAGYLHDLREIKFNGKDEALWRTAHSLTRNGNLYPTHGLGPVAEAMDINHGDRFDTLVSMSSVSRGLNLYAAEKFGKDDPRAARNYALGDVNTTLIRTVRGRTITLIHDCSSPRPYSRIDRIQGTAGIIEGYPDRIHIENRSPAHTWEDFDDYLDEFRHPLWKEIGNLAQGAGHGGMDFLEDYRLVRALLEGRSPDMDVYDAAAWSAVSELSERSAARRGRSMKFPDFTRGAWENSSPIFITDM